MRWWRIKFELIWLCRKVPFLRRWFPLRELTPAERRLIDIVTRQNPYTGLLGKTPFPHHAADQKSKDAK